MNNDDKRKCSVVLFFFVSLLLCLVLDGKVSGQDWGPRSQSATMCHTPSETSRVKQCALSKQRLPHQRAQGHFQKHNRSHLAVMTCVSSGFSSTAPWQGCHWWNVQEVSLSSAAMPSPSHRHTKPLMTVQWLLIASHGPGNVSNAEWEVG